MEKLIGNLNWNSADVARWMARAVFVTWAGFWVWFNLASGFGELHTDGWQALAGHMVMTALVLALAWLAWNRELFGGVGLIVMAGLCFWRFQNPLWLTTQWLVPLILVVPPLISGLMLLVVAALSKHGH